MRVITIVIGKEPEAVCMFVSVDLCHDDVSIGVQEVDVGIVVGGVEEGNHGIPFEVARRSVSGYDHLQKGIFEREQMNHLTP